MSKKFCKFCGDEINKNDIFCKGCGAKVEKNEEIKDAIIDGEKINKSNTKFLLFLIVILLIIIVVTGLFLILFRN